MENYSHQLVEHEKKKKASCLLPGCAGAEGVRRTSGTGTGTGTGTAQHSTAQHSRFVAVSALRSCASKSGEKSVSGELVRSTLESLS